jgi:hypothetical protein
MAKLTAGSSVTVSWSWLLMVGLYPALSQMSSILPQDQLMSRRHQLSRYPQAYEEETVGNVRSKGA